MIANRIVSSPYRILAAAFVAITMALSSLAARADMSHTVQFDINPQLLSDALVRYSAQSGVQVTSPAELLEGKSSSGVVGSYSAQDALKRLLNGTNLEYEVIGNSTVTIRAAARMGKGAAMSGDDVGRTPEDLKLANVEAASADNLQNADSGESTVRSPSENQSSKIDAQDVVVTGTRLRSKVKVEETRSYSREAIQASGQRNVVAFLNTLPEVSQVSAANPVIGFGSPSVVQLRGLPIGTTLVLLDGQRLSPSGNSSTGAFDVSQIPSPLIQRVDVVPFGSSAVYGSDAIGGVVNFVLRKDLDGGSMDASYGSASQFATQSITASYGRKGERVSYGVAASYYHNDALLDADRSLSRDADYSRFAALGGVDRRVTSCSPGTVTAVSGTLPGVGAAFAAIPAGLSGRPATSAFAPGAGARNLCNLRLLTPLVPATERSNALAYVRFSVSEAVTLNAQLLYGHIASDALSIPPTVSAVTVPVSNAFNPFGVPVRVDASIPGLRTGDMDRSEFLRPVANFHADLGAEWGFDLTAQMSRTRDRVTTLNNTANPALLTALASGDPATALNLFSSVSAGSDALLAQIFQSLPNVFHGLGETAQIVARGPLVHLPAGSMEVAIGGEFEHSSFYRSNSSLLTGTPVPTIGRGSRDVRSVFTEVRVPLAAAASGRPILSVDGAVRWDDFSDVGSTTTPQLGLLFTPSRTLSLRASWSDAFRAPSLRALYSPTFNSVAINVADPQNGGALVTFPTVGGGTLHLRPETGNTLSATLAWHDSEAIPGLEVSISPWKIEEDDRVSANLLTPQIVLANPGLFGDRVTRNGAGQIIGMDLTTANFGRLRVEGVDVAFNYRVSTAAGDFAPAASFSRITTFKAAVLPNTPEVDRLARATAGDAWAPKFKATVRLDWVRDRLSAGVGGRYLGSYLDYQSPANTNRNGDFWLVDLNARFELGGVLSSVVKKPSIAISLSNVFDEAPQYSNYPVSLGYDPYQADIIGRQITARIGFDF